VLEVREVSRCNEEAIGEIRDGPRGFQRLQSKVSINTATTDETDGNTETHLEDVRSCENLGSSA